MGEKTRESIKDRIEQSRKRIESLRSKGIDTAQLTIIFNKIDTAFRSGNVKEENLSEAVKKLENLLQVTEKIREKPAADERKKDAKAASKKGASASTDLRSELKSLSELEEKVKALGGDLSPIFHHLDAIREASIANDEAVFISYRDTVKPWLHEYLFNLKKAKVESMKERIGSNIKELTDGGREDLAQPLRTEMEALAPLIQKAGEDMDILLSDLEATVQQAEKAKETLVNDQKGRIIALQRELRSLLELKEPMFDKSSFREALVQTTKMTEDGQFAKAMDELKKRMDEVKRIVYREKTETLARFLKLLDPVISKVGDSHGHGSETYQRIKKKRDEIGSLPIDRLDEGLKEVEGLLDEAAKASAEAEEKAIRSMQERIEAMVRDIEGMPSREAQSVIKVTNRVREILVEGDLQGAAKVLERAESTYRTLVQKKEKVKLDGELKAIHTRLTEKSSRGRDVMHLEESLALAQELMMRNSFPESREKIALIEKGLSVLDESDIKEEMSSLLAEIGSEIEIIRSSGSEPRDLQKQFEEAISLSGTDIPGSLQILRKMSMTLRTGKTERVLKQKMAEIDDMLREAKAFGLDAKSVESEIEAAKKALVSSQLDNALEIVAKAKVYLESMIRERSVKRLENEIEIIAGEMRRLNLVTGEYKSKIAAAYAMVEENRTEEAVSQLTDLKNDLEKKLTGKRIVAMMDSMAARIREARMHNIEITGYKADLTKARVRYEAGDIDGAMKDIIQSLRSLEDILTKKKALRGKMDQLRGSLITIEGKVARLSSRGVDTSEYQSRLALLKSHIENGNESSAREALEGLDADITKLFRDLPVLSISEGPYSQVRPAPDKGGRPSIEIAKAGEAPAEDIDPNEARRRLQILLTRIGRAVQMGGAKVQEQSRGDLERIKQLIVDRNYNAAYRIAMDCMERLGG